MAPIIYCPSAPIFQILALKPIDRPKAIKIKGAPFMKICGMEYVEKVSLIRGSQKIILIAAKGSTPKK